jgi:hypothetical protein
MPCLGPNKFGCSVFSATDRSSAITNDMTVGVVPVNGIGFCRISVIRMGGTCSVWSGDWSSVFSRVSEMDSSA